MKRYARLKAMPCLVPVPALSMAEGTGGPIFAGAGALLMGDTGGDAVEP